MSHRKDLVSLLLGSAIAFGPHVVRAQVSTRLPAADSLAPGRRIRVFLVQADGSGLNPSHRRVEGSLIALDRDAITVRVDSGPRRISRQDVERVSAYSGRSRWRGLLAGWALSLPVALIACRDQETECERGQLIGLVGGVAGFTIGWPRWKAVELSR